MGQYIAELVLPSESTWNSIKPDILFLETEAFGENAYPEEQLQEGFTNPANIVVILRDTSTDKVIGFLYTLPIDTYEKELQYERKETVLIDNVVIGKDYRGNGLVAKLHEVAESEMRKRGYKYFMIQAQIENGYAKNTEKGYRDRIVSGPTRTDPQYDA